MDMGNQLPSELLVGTEPTGQEINVFSDSTIQIADPRVAQLLLILNELDECVAGLEALPESELGDVVLGAVLASGFADPEDARCAIAPVLEALEIDGSIPENS